MYMYMCKLYDITKQYQASKKGKTKGGKQAQARKEASSSKRGRKNACVKKKGKNEGKK